MSQPLQGKTTNQKVLLCEDEAIVALDIQIMLEDLGFDLVRHASPGVGNGNQDALC